MLNSKFIVYFILSFTHYVAAANFKIKIVDAETAELVAARVLILNGEGISLVPKESLTLQVGNETWFMSPGISEVETDSDMITLRVERGKEYERIKKSINLSQSVLNEVEIEMKRWINMKDLGYLSSENHIHLPADDVATMCIAEDLDYGTSLQWWNHPRFGVPSGKSNILDLSFASENVQVSIFDVEVEEEWGALYIINMPSPFPYLNDKEMPNLIAAEYANDKGALSCYQGGWSREVLVDALLGLVDVVNVCNNNFHMHRYQPRSHYSNLLEVEGLPIYPNTSAGMMQMNTDTYYRLLNCGLQIAAGAGSAIGAKETPLGYNRSYVRIDGNKDWQNYIKNWREGKNFVTNGPMIFLKTTEDLKPGDIKNFSDEEEINLEVKVISDSPLRTVEIISNGSVVKKFQLTENEMKFSAECKININESSWICARVTDEDLLLSDKEIENYRSPRRKLYQDPNRLRYAHTSPIYFYLNGRGIVVEKSVKEGIKIVEAFKDFAQKNSSSKYLDDIINASKKAKQILLNKLK